MGGELWIQIDGIWRRAYELVGANVNTTRGPFLRSSQGLHYSEPPVRMSAPSTPTHAGRLSRSLRAEYAEGDDFPRDDSQPPTTDRLVFRV